MKPLLIAAVLLSLVACASKAPDPVACLPAGSAWPADWTEPYPPHRVIGNLYAVGNAGLSVFLVTTPDGHVLVNTGLEDSASMIRKNIEAMGFSIDDVKILLTTQAHFDHTAALAEIQSLTGASLYATEADARVLRDGGASDAHFGRCLEFRFKPVTVERILADGETIELGGVTLTTHLHPGHTEGSSSYSWTVRENGRDYAVAIVNMGSINDGKRLLVNPTYPGVAQDFANTYHRQKQMQVDVWVSSHGAQYNLDKKHVPGQAYNPDAFVDPYGLAAEVERLQQRYLEQIDAEINGTY